MFRGLIAVAGLALSVSVALAQDAYPSRNVTIVVPLAAAPAPTSWRGSLARGLTASSASRSLWKIGPARTPLRAPNMRRGSRTTVTPDVRRQRHAFRQSAPFQDHQIRSDQGLYTIRGLPPPALDAGPAGQSLQIDGRLIRDAKANPGKLTYGEPNAGSQIASETIKKVMGLDITRAPYRATPQAMTDVFAGTITMAFVDVAGALVQLSPRQARALVITSANRSALLPDVPTMQEAGFKDFDLTYWTRLFGSADLPRMWSRRSTARRARSWARTRCKTRSARWGSNRRTCRRRPCRPMCRPTRPLGRFRARGGHRAELTPCPARRPQSAS